MRISASSDQPRSTATIGTMTEDAICDTAESQPQQEEQDRPQQQQQSSKETPPLDRSVSERAAHENLYVSGLTSVVKDHHIKALFSPFGTIESAKVMLNIHTGLSRGIAFVKFANVEDAIKAQAALDGHRDERLQPTAISVKFADKKASYNPGRPTNRVFVRNLPLSLTKGEIIEYFSVYGEVSECTMHADTATAKGGDQGRVAPTHMAYLTFKDIPTAQKVADAVHGEQPFRACTIPLLAKVAESEEKRSDRLKRQGRSGSGSAPTDAQPQAFPMPPVPIAPGTFPAYPGSYPQMMPQAPQAQPGLYPSGLPPTQPYPYAPIAGQQPMMYPQMVTPGFQQPIQVLPPQPLPNPAFAPAAPGSALPFPPTMNPQAQPPMMAPPLFSTGVPSAPPPAPSSTVQQSTPASPVHQQPVMVVVNNPPSPPLTPK